MNEPSHSPPPLADSPWFWLFLFSACALAALLAIGPKHLQRQGRLEQQKQAREQAWQTRSRGAADGQAAQPHTPAESGGPAPAARGFWPLAAVLALVTAALGGLLALSRRRAAHQPGAGSAAATHGDQRG